MKQSQIQAHMNKKISLNNEKQNQKLLREKENASKIAEKFAIKLENGDFIIDDSIHKVICKLKHDVDSINHNINNDIKQQILQYLHNNNLIDVKDIEINIHRPYSCTDDIFLECGSACFCCFFCFPCALIMILIDCLNVKKANIEISYYTK